MVGVAALCTCWLPRAGTAGHERQQKASVRLVFWGEQGGAVFAVCLLFFFTFFFFQCYSCIIKAFHPSLV